MSVADKIGGFRLLLWIYDLNPFAAFLTTIAVDFVAICLLMWLEGLAPWKRTHYKTFLWNDTVFLPLYVAMVVVILRGSGPLDGFYTTRLWHWTIFVSGFALSFYLEWGALKSGQYTWAQEMSPSKLWHTFIFGVMFYWLASTLIPVLVVHRPFSAMVFVAVALIGFIAMCYLDATLPQPWNAHLEGTYAPWEWHERKR